MDELRGSVTAFDPGEGTAPAGLEAGSGGEVAVLRLSAGADRTWAASTAMAVARDWASAGRPVFLADLCLREPLLPAHAGVGAGEGLSDVFLYGASLRRVSTAPEGERFLVAGPGTPVADPSAVLAHERWGEVLEGFRQAGASLVVVLPAADAAVAAWTVGADRVVDLLGPGEAAREGALGLAPLSLSGAAAASAAEAEAPVETETLGESPADPEPVPAPADAEPSPIDAPTAFEESAVTDEPKEGEDAEGGMFSLDGFSDEPASAPAKSEGLADFDLSGLEGDRYHMDAEAGPAGSPGADESPDDAAVPAEATGGPAEGTPSSPAAPEEDATAEAPGPAAEAPEETPDFSFDFDPSELAVEGSDEMSLEDAEAALEAAEHEAAGAGPDGGTDAAGAPAGSLGAADEPLAAPGEAPATEQTEAGSTMGGFGDDAVMGADIEGADEHDLSGMERIEVEGTSLADGGVDVDAGMMEGVNQGPDFGGDFQLEGANPFASEPEPVAGGSPFATGALEGVGDEAAPEEAPAGASGDDMGLVTGPDLGTGSPFADQDNPFASAEPAGGAFAEAVPDDDTAPVLDVPLDDAPGPAAAAEETVEVGEDGLKVRAERKLSGLEKLEKKRRWQARMQMLVRVAAVLVLLGGLVLGAAWMGFIDIPGITPVERRVGVPPTVQLEGPQPVTAVLSHALVIDSWRTYETPRDLVPALGSRLPEMLFYVSVVDAGERGRQFELLAGPATSALEADALRGPLAEVLDRYDPASWRVVDAPLAFFFGEYPDREAADARAAQLDGLGVPAYVLQVEYEGARTAYRVYGGAFSDEFQAAAMAALIGEAGLSDIPLIERRGHRPE